MWTVREAERKALPTALLNVVRDWAVSDLRQHFDAVGGPEHIEDPMVLDPL